MPRVPTTASVSNPHQRGYDFRIDSKLFRASTSQDRQMVIRTEEFPNQQINLKQNPEDISTNIGQIFSRNNFSGGQGLDTAHRKNAKEDDSIKFWDSAGVDVFNIDKGENYTVKLLNQMSNSPEQATSSTDGDNYTARVGTTLYASDDGTLYKSTDGGDTWATQSISITSGYQIKGLAVFGSLLYVVANNGSNGEIIKWDGSSATQVDTDKIFSGIWSAKGVLFVTWVESNIAYIQQYDGGTGTTFATGSSIITLTQGQTFTDLVDAGAVVLATATDGYIYSIKDITGTFTLKGQTEITGEIPTCIAEAQGIIFYGTKEEQTGSTTIGRFYRADLSVADDLYILSNNQLIKEWENSGIDSSPKTLFVSRDSVYTGIKESTTEANLWRYYLPTAGLSRTYKCDIATGTLDVISGIEYINSKFVVLVQQEGIFLQQSTYENTGYIILPNADFYTSDEKQWVGTTVEHETIDDSRRVQCYISTKFEDINNPDSTNWLLTNDSSTGRGNEEAQINENSRYLSTKIVLTSKADFTATPSFNSVAVRALPRPQVVVVDLPVNLSDQYERANRKRIKVRNLGETIYQELKEFEGDSVTLEIYDPAETIRGVVESVAYPVINNASIGSVTQYCTVRVKGVRASSSVTPSSNILGVGTIGVIRLG
tara:strand:- start:8832 stop:10799 length:1968 start_codon:yes stop_codon:yes gene_type:complete